MNITEAQAVQRITAFAAGEVDHCDETTRAEIARDLLWLQTRAHAALMAGPVDSEQTWAERLCRITFEP